MSRQQSRYGLPKDPNFREALEASDDGYSDDDRSSYSGSSRSSGSTRSSAYSASSASARSLDRYADRASAAKKGQGGSSRSRQQQMKKNRRRRRGEKQRHGSNSGQAAGGRKPDPRVGADHPDGPSSAAVRKAAVTTTPGGRGEGQKKGAPQAVHRDTRYDVPSHKKRRKRPNKRKEKHPTSSAGTDAAASASGTAAASAASASAPDKYAASVMDYLDEDPDGQIEITLSPSDSYGVEVHESRNVSNRGYAFAKPLDKRYMGKDDDKVAGDDSGQHDRKISSKMTENAGKKAASKSSPSTVQVAKFSLSYPALASKPLPSVLTDNAGMHRLPLQSSVSDITGGSKSSTSSAKELLLSMPVCDELSAFHREAYLMQQEISAIKSDRLVREIDSIKEYNRRVGRKPLALGELDEGGGGEFATSSIFQDEEWDVDVLLASHADGGRGKSNERRKGKWKGRRDADNSRRDTSPESSAVSRTQLTNQQRRKLERNRGICLTVHISDEEIQDAFKTEFANIANAIEESDTGGTSTILSSSDAKVRDITDKYSTMTVSPEKSPQKKLSSATLTSTASKLITVIGCRALRSINFSSISEIASTSRYDTDHGNLGFWYVSDDNSASCVGMPPPKFAERLSRERNLPSGGAYPVSNVRYMASGPLGSYFVRFASGETWWGLGGDCPTQHEQFAQIINKLDVRRIAFGPPRSEFIKEGSTTVTVIPWVILGSDGTVAWSSSLPPSLERLLSDRPRDCASPVEISLGAGGSYFVKFADGDFKCVVSSPLANVCRQIEAKGARITNMILHAEIHDYIIRHSKFCKA